MSELRDVEGDIAYVRACLRTDGSRQMLDRIAAALADRDAKLAALTRINHLYSDFVAEFCGYMEGPDANGYSHPCVLPVEHEGDCILDSALSLSVPTSPQTKENDMTEQCVDARTDAADAYGDAVAALAEVTGGAPLSTTIGWMIRARMLIVNPVPPTTTEITKNWPVPTSPQTEEQR